MEWGGIPVPVRKIRISLRVLSRPGNREAEEGEMDVIYLYPNRQLVLGRGPVTACRDTSVSRQQLALHFVCPGEKASPVKSEPDHHTGESDQWHTLIAPRAFVLLTNMGTAECAVWQSQQEPPCLWKLKLEATPVDARVQNPAILRKTCAVQLQPGDAFSLRERGQTIYYVAVEVEDQPPELTEYLECTTSGHNKFWTISCRENTTRVLYGRIGTNGVAQNKIHASNTEAESFAQKMIENKLRKGYKVVTQAGATRPIVVKSESENEGDEAEAEPMMEDDDDEWRPAGAPRAVVAGKDESTVPNVKLRWKLKKPGGEEFEAVVDGSYSNTIFRKGSTSKGWTDKEHDSHAAAVSFCKSQVVFWSRKGFVLVESPDESEEITTRGAGRMTKRKREMDENDSSVSVSSSSPSNVHQMVFCITGTLSMVRSRFIALLEQHGANFSKSMSRRTTHLIQGKRGAETTKADRAEEWGIPVVDEEWVLSLLPNNGDVSPKSPTKRQRTGPRNKKGDDDESNNDEAEGSDIGEMVFCITGTLTMVRQQFIALLEDRGAQFTKSVTKRTTHLIQGKRGSETSKADRATELGIPIVKEEWVLSLIENKKTNPRSGKDEMSDNGNDTEEDVNGCGGVDLEEGETREFPSGGEKPHVVKYTGGVYSCSCPAWRFQSKPINTRTCKHIVELRGESREKKRVGNLKRVTKSSVSSPVKGKAPQLLLAKKWEHRDPTGWWMSEKLDGLRAYWTGRNPDWPEGTLLSRLGNKFHAPEWFIRSLPDHPLDGELFMGRGRFQECVSVVRSFDAGDRWKEIKYLVFDTTCNHTPFEKRYQELKNVVERAECEWIELVEHNQCKGASHLEKELERVEELGGEGLMLRQPGSKYQGTRSSTLLKVKTFTDAEATVIGHTRGEGRHTGRCGALEVRTMDGTCFKVGTGLSDRQRENPPPIGTGAQKQRPKCNHKFQELTRDGKPRFPSFVRVRADAGL